MHLRQRVTAHAGRVCPRGFRRNASDPAQLTPLKPEVRGAYASVFRCARDVGYKTFPETWDALRDAGKKLKAAKGRPLGQTAGHTFGDAPAWYPYVCESVKLATGPWKESCDEGGVAWDDTINMRAFLSGSISAPNNGASIYIEVSANLTRIRPRRAYRNGSTLHANSVVNVQGGNDTLGDDPGAETARRACSRV